VVKEAVFAVPGDLSTPTGGYVYDRRIIGELQALGWRIDVLDLGDGFPHPTPTTRAGACKQLALLAHGSVIVIDGLAYGALPEAAELLHPRHRVIALVHHPLALETGLNAEQAGALRESERAALSRAHHVIATSAATARLLAADYGVGADRLTVVQPGTDRATPQPRECGAVVAILSVGAVVPRKGHDILVAALAQLGHLPWRLLIVGDRERSVETARKLDQDIVRFGLAERIAFTGAVSPQRLAALYASADLFVLSSRFEGYGMAYAEAIAHGLPVVGTNAGAIPETVPPGAGVLLAPDDVGALVATLRRLIESPAERMVLAAGARAAAATFPSWRDSAMLFSQALDSVA